MVSVLRKLAIWAFSFSAAVFAAYYVLPLSALLWLALGFALAALLLLLCRQKWLQGFLLASAGLAVGFLCYALHAQFTLVPAVDLSGKTLEIRGEVCAYPQVGPGYSRVLLRMDSGELPRGKLLLYADGAQLASLKPGDELSCSAKLKRTDERYGKRYDTNLARGVYLTGNAASALRVVPGGAGLRYLPLRVNRLLSDTVGKLFPQDVAAFEKSLMLGDKSDLYQDRELYLALNRAGFLHVVAVSGMHIAFLVGLIQLMFGKTRRSSLLCLALLWFFVLITGSSPSAVRAGVMQSFLLIAPMVRRENDPATSLSAALCILLLANPFAAGSVSLQLSFSAMAGILLLAEPLRDTISDLLPERGAALLRTPISIATSSLAVLAFSVPLMAWHFGTVSILSPLSNMLGLWVVSFCFCGGYLSCLLGFLAPAVGSGAAWIVSWFARYLFLLSRLVSQVPISTLYLRSVLPYLWIAFVYLLAVLSRFLPFRKGMRFLLTLSLSVFTLALLLFFTRQYYRSEEGVVSVIDVGQGQSVAVMAGDSTVLIDCGSIYSLDNAGEEAGAYLLSRGRTRVDALILTHLHSDHCNGVPMLMEMLPVKTLILPADLEDEDGMLPEILAGAEKHDTQIRFLESDAVLQTGSVRASLFMPLSEGAVNERCLTGVFSLGDYDVLITGDSSASTERAMLKRHPLRDLELLIVGHHGSRYASSEELLRSIGANTAVISVGYNPYGHPTAETLDRLQAAGYRVFRTDRDGTVEFYLGKENGQENQQKN